MAIQPRANLIAGEWAPAARGATFVERCGSSAHAWPQSAVEDVARAREAARSHGRAWRELSSGRREELLLAWARELEHDALFDELLASRFGASAEEVAPHRAGLEAAVAESLGNRPVEQAGIAWCASDWRELARSPLLDLARELQAGRTLVLISDARLPALAERLAVAARAAGLPPGTLGLLHGSTRELLTLALAGAGDGPGATLVASGLAERVVDLRRLCELQGLGDPRLRTLRCGAYEVDPARELADSAREVVELSFGRGTTLSGQLPGALARVFCPARVFSRFSELLLEQLEASTAARAPLPQIDEEAVMNARAAWELGLDEGATCIAGGDEMAAASRVVQPMVFTNVEPHMASARRQEPLPLLCLVRAK